jgi:hypothetical protein
LARPAHLGFSFNRKAIPMGEPVATTDLQPPASMFQGLRPAITTSRRGTAIVVETSGYLLLQRSEIP